MSGNADTKKKVQDLIGVIVPVYKAEKYIAECIESILEQTYTNFRLILVDDGTPDGAGKICDEYGGKDSRITVIHQQNAGVTRARARGVEEAKDCEFITFVDSDDTLTTDALERMHQRMENGTGIVMCNNYLANGTDTRFYEIPREQTRVETSFFIKRKIWLNGGAPWGKLFRRELFDGSTFDIPRHIICGEDVIMNIRIAFNSKTPIEIIHKPLYNYRIHTQSVFNNFERTAEYENFFWAEVLRAIPVEHIPEFINDHICIRLVIWKKYNDKIKSPAWAGTLFHAQLISDIVNFNYPISFFDRQLLLKTNPVARVIIKLAQKVSKPFMKLIKK